MSRPVHIIAVGARCAVGLTAESSAAAIRAGISRIAEHPYLTDATGEKLLCARDLRLDPTIPGPERMVMLAEACLREVVAKTNIALSYSRIGPVLLALPEVRPGFSEQNALFLQQALASCGIPGLGFIRTTHLTAGHAGALSALRLAIEHVAHGGDELCIAGGVDSYLVPATVDWLESDRRLARGGIRCGFPPGEGAAMVVVASDMALRRLRLTSLARVRAVACTQELKSPTSDEGLLGEGLTDAVKRATVELSFPQEQISDTYGDINGERTRAEDWGFTLLRAGERFRDGTAYVTPVGQCGDVGAATGALGCVLAVQSWQRRYAHGPRALVWAGSWGGLRGAAVLEAED